MSRSYKTRKTSEPFFIKGEKDLKTFRKTKKTRGHLVYKTSLIDYQ